MKSVTVGEAIHRLPDARSLLGALTPDDRLEPEEIRQSRKASFTSDEEAGE